MPSINQWPSGQIFQIANFPHEWKAFVFERVEGANVVLRKHSNKQSFEVPIQNLSPIAEFKPWEVPQMKLSGEVGLRDDGLGRLGEWFQKN
jgi:hypothetical protein